MENILLIIGVILACWLSASVIYVAIYILWRIFFDKDDGTHITKSIRKLWEDEDED